MPRERRSMQSFLWALVLLSALASGGSAASALAGQAPQAAPAPGEIVLRAYSFKYQRASEVMTLIYPLLSPRGTIELQPGGNTVVIRDTSETIRRILPVLKGFDHPARPLRLEVYVVRASRNTVSPQIQRSDLPEALTKRLRDLLAYDVYEVQAQAQLSGTEGQWVDYELGPDYKLSFRFGTLMTDQRLKLSSFQISRRAEGKLPGVLLQTNLNLWVDQTTSLGLAKSEASHEALMVVLTLRDGR